MFAPTVLAAANAIPKPSVATKPSEEPPSPVVPFSGHSDLAAQLRALIAPIPQETTVSGKRREGNAKLDLLLRKVTSLEREHGALERPSAPRHTRARPLRTD
jgi:hypothetical protein